MDYLLKSTICLTAFYGLYFFGFRRMSFHTLNRFYLLVSLALSLTIPLLSYERTEIVVLEPQPIQEATFAVEETQKNTDNQAFVIQQSTITNEVPDTIINWISILNTIYLMGVGVMFFLFLKNILTILYSIKKASALVAPTVASTSLSHQKQSKKLKILLTKKQSNSSFFNYVFLNSDNLNPHEEALIIAHEGFHAQRLHTLDLLILGILKAVFWFNPIVYFYQKSLKQIHEYEVDALMSATYDGREYAHLLLKLGVAPSAMIINQFSTKPLSERIQFLFKTPTKNMKKLLYFLSLPIIAVGVMAFAEEKVVRVYQEGQKNKILQKSMPAQSPLKVFYKNTQDKNVPSLMSFSERNLILNDLFLLPAATYYYVNPNFLTIEGIKEVNTKLKDKGYSIIVNEQEKDSQNNLTKLTLSIKNLKIQKTTQTREIDMVHAREVGKQGAWLFFEIYKNHFQDSDVILTEGTSDLEINVGEKAATTYVNITSNLRISKGEIVYKVSPDKLNLKTFEKVKKYFAKEGFTLLLKNEIFDSNNNLVSLTIEINNGKEKVEKQIILNDLRHLVKSKNIKTTRTQRADETIVIEADKETQEVKVSYDNKWFDLFRKSGNFEVLKVTNNVLIPKIDSSRFSYHFPVMPKNGNADSFKVIINKKTLVEGKDFIIKNNTIYIDKKYGGSKISYHVYSSSGAIIYPELTKLNKVEFPDMRFSSKTPVFFAKNENKSVPQIGKSRSYFSKIMRNQDTLRTILETNKLGKNPIVIINDVEYPSSILYRINPYNTRGYQMYSKGSQRAIEKYGLRAEDGVVILNTVKSKELLLENEKQHRIAVDNVKKQLDAPKKRIQRVVLKDLDGKEYEKVSVMRLDLSTINFSVDIPVRGKVIFMVDGKEVSENEIEIAKQIYIGGGCGETPGGKYDAYINLYTQK